MSKPLQVEIFVNEQWESGYSISRADMDKVYKFMDLLLMQGSGELDFSAITDEVDDAYERSGL